ncbi:MAG TPA: SagB/ThcOx family dehydrogenase [Gaiellaceae bacterium]
MAVEIEKRAAPPRVVLAPTVKGAAIVYSGEPAADDAAEHFHEESKLYPSFGIRQTRGYLLDLRVDLRHSTTRAVKRYRTARRVELPPAQLPSTSLEEAIARRQSHRAFNDASIRVEQLAALLHAGYGITHQLAYATPDEAGPYLRTVPSGGGLYPLELFVFAYAVDGLRPALYHYDPPAHRLDELSVAPAVELRRRAASAAVYPELAGGGAALIVMSAMFWRTRFKYGLRGYRFALIEAGHVAQNMLLTATGLRLGSVPLGGIFDRRMDELLDLDGVNESVLYAVSVGVVDESV